MRRSFLLLFLLAAGVLPAKKLHYTVDLRNSASGSILVSLELEMMGAEVVYYQMPAWAPGAYAMTNYGRFVQNLQAYGHNGREKPVERINENRWHILHGKDIRTITYEVANSYLDSTSLYFALAHFDSSLVFANAPALFGYVNDQKDLPAEVTYLYPSTWQLHTVLDSVSQGNGKAHFHAKNYDELIDAPVMAGPDFQTSSFQLGKCRFDIIVTSDRPFAMDSLTHYTRRIVEAQLDFFRDTPFVNYKFLINAPTYLKLPRKDQGALEHANSSAYLLMNYEWDYIRDPICHILSHEVFHAWNVKRIHSTKLGPFDYTKPVRTTELWLAEGITDYYSHILLSRHNILPAHAIAESFNALYEGVSDSDKPYTMSLEELSLEESNFKIENAMQFYTRGPLCGLMLDIELRERSNHRTSLDQVLLALNQEAKQGKHYKDDQLVQKITKITGIDWKAFHAKYIAGTAAYPIDEYFRKLGIGRRVRFSERNGVSLRTDFDTSSRFLIIDRFFESSPLLKAGLSTGDTVLEIGTRKASAAMLKEWGTSHEAPYRERFLFGTGSGRVEKTISLTIPRESFTNTLPVAVLPETTAEQDTLRYAIFGRNFNFVGWKPNSTIRTFETNLPPPKH